MPTPFFADLVRELAQDGGTGPLTPTGAVPGHRRFADAVPPGASFHYAVAGIARPEQWEVGTGRIDVDGRLLRETVAASSAGGATVDFATGLKTIALTVGAGWFAASDTQAATLAAGVTAVGGELAGLADAVEAKQPLSTTHASAGAGDATDAVTVRRGAGWVNIPLSALAFRDGDGRYALDGALAARNGSALAPSIGFAGDGGTGLWQPASNILGFATNGAERARITGSGNFGIGASAPAALLHVRGGGAGATQLRLESSATQPNIAFYNGSGNVNDRNWAIVASHVAYGELVFRRSNASAGDPLAAGTTLFRILPEGQLQGVSGTSAAPAYSFAADPDTGLMLSASNQIALVTDGAQRLTVDAAGNVTPGGDNIQVLGWSSARWSLIYAGTGTINTSDAREKTWRGEPTIEEIAAARRIIGELGFFRWDHAIAMKGEDGARLHFGVRAQAVWAIMADEGLIDPIAEGAASSSRYAFLCHDKWDEEATGEGPPAGDRFGVRTDQLALFLIAAQDARLAALEAAA
ncbi:hypothetical protein E5675_17690 [Sphingopyxis sp. PAMC25046]|uniref:tail fiber domain-containing protein n=1 Tax=Sphingopyxis sp. PAMC25046 TaxID=2565556 RepID=UPI00109DD216|nr:tail fiber domain-containing protein [Sphingopyxis sp. PAMC25046]QCB56084.1 hypothetical protein E5675_17690 [Sphingopyxis sp. PAMC25046]